ncbi:MAG: tRNA (guanosine(37)-N1)-methyltransferase TrmD [Ruminococcaceae bacterium]|nr:tRNA (guanosine(37)-N1)-methyltransferase TrmD [Oscillospiraceae bacterium]
MNFHVLTLFPEMFSGVLHSSMLGRAEEKGILSFNLINIRDFSGNKHNRVDDAPYGGGRGMVMQAPPVYDAYESVASKLEKKPHVIYMSPKGHNFTQQKAIELSKKEDIILLCGHYEGIDQRVLDEIVDEEISIGDYVLTGGEIPAMVVIDSVSRMIDGVLSNEESFTDESHFDGLLEYPHFTRPPVFHAMAVPDVLLSGDHAKIEAWRRRQSLLITKEKRPDMYEKNADVYESELNPLPKAGRKR